MRLDSLILILIAVFLLFKGAVDLFYSDSWVPGKRGWSFKHFKNKFKKK